MDRRSFIGLSIASAAAAWLAGEGSAAGDRLRIMTVEGPVGVEEMGLTLPHEHVLVDFIGAERVSRDRYDAEEVFRVARPQLERGRELGCRTLVECTPAYLGRDAALLRRLAEATGVKLLTNTGYYGAARGRFLPAHAHTETADELAGRWVREWREGIERTGIRPGFIKTGVDAGPLAEVNRKLIRAGGRAHLASGLTIAAHTGDGAAAMEELALLREEGVDGSALIWVHAQNERDGAFHRRAAAAGAWVEFDGISADSMERHVGLVRSAREGGYLDRILLSHDAGWYHVGEEGGGRFRPYEALFTRLIPRLREEAFTEEEIAQLTVVNPREAFAIRVRAAG